jgi:hypothetical protein
LLSLVRRDLISRGAPDFSGEEAYHFRHVLLRDAAYRSLSKQLRAELHERFAACFSTVSRLTLATRSLLRLLPMPPRDWRRRPGGHLDAATCPRLSHYWSACAPRCLSCSPRTIPDEECCSPNWAAH